RRGRVLRTATVEADCRQVDGAVLADDVEEVLADLRRGTPATGGEEDVDVSRGGTLVVDLLRRRVLVLLVRELALLRADHDRVGVARPADRHRAAAVVDRLGESLEALDLPTLGEARDVRGGGDDDLVTSGLDLGVRRVLRQGAEANALVEVRGGLQPGVGGGANGRLDRGPDGRGENVIRRRRDELTLGLGLGGVALAVATVATGVVAVTAVIVLTRDPLAKSVGALTLLLRLGVLL